MKKLELATDDEDLWFDEGKWGMGESDLIVNRITPTPSQ
jgi:hypothetical protein